MKKTSAERKIIAGFVVLAVALAGVAWLSSQTLRSSVAQQQWVTHTYQVMESLQRGRLLLVKAQTDQRNYLFTGDTNFEKASDDDRASATAWLKQLGHWIQDNRGQQQRLNDLKPLVSQWLSFVTQQTTLPPRRGWISEDATATEQGANLFQGISLRLTQMESVETRLLQERQQRLDTDAELTGTFIVAAAVLAVALGWVSLIFIHRDLDERRRTEKALRQSEERARLTVQIIRDYAIFMLDAGGRVASWNIGAERIKGYKTEEIVGKHFSIFYPEAIARRGIPEKALQQARDEGRCEHEGWRVRKNGSRFWAHAVITAMRHEDGSLIGFAKVTRDLTEQKRAEAVREERDRFFELSRDMMCVAGFDGWFKSVNPAWEQTLGFSREELLDKPFIEFVHPDDRAVTHIETQKMMAGGETIRMENRCLCRDGAWRRFAWSARPDMERQLIYGTARDITEEAKVQAQILTLNESLQRHSRQLEAANKELEAFSYSVSHDLRAPLRHIGGFVRLLNKQVNGNMDEASRRYLDIIADAAQRMGALIDDLLIFSRMGRAELRRTPVIPGAMIQEIIDSLQGEIGNRRIVWNLGELPKVEADLAMLRQVWANLIGNAVKYTRPRDPAEIEIRCEERDTEWVFRVRDNGVGFDMQYAHKLFGVFQRLHRSDEFEGTGIGLANVQRIIHRHGGRVWAEAAVDRGATFFFSLPKPQPSTETKGHNHGAIETHLAG